MSGKLRTLFILLSLLALFVIGFDYVCGHMEENPFLPDTCPICASFHSTELGYLLIFLLMFLGILPLTGFISLHSSCSVISLHLSTFSNRSPPSVK